MVVAVALIQGCLGKASPHTRQTVSCRKRPMCNRYLCSPESLIGILENLSGYLPTQRLRMLFEHPDTRALSNPARSIFPDSRSTRSTAESSSGERRQNFYVADKLFTPMSSIFRKAKGHFVRTLQRAA